MITANGPDVGVHLGNGDGTFQSEQDTGSSHNVQSLAIADFNGDGRLDAAAADYQFVGTRQVEILLGNGDGTFQHRSIYTIGYWATCVTAADLNKDGKPISPSRIGTRTTVL